MPAIIAAASVLLIAPLHAGMPRTSAEPQTSSSRQADGPTADASLPPPVPLREGAKIAYIDLPFIAAQSAEGKAAGMKLKTFQESRTRELQSKQQSVEAKQKQLASGSSLLSETARAALEAEIARDSRDLTHLADDADQEAQQLNERLQQEFIDKIVRAVTRVAKEKKIDLVFTDRSSMAFRAEDLNLSLDVIRALDAPGVDAPPAGTSQPAATPPPGP
jgi:Skp family chaperone for outer membrane proteins